MNQKERGKYKVKRQRDGDDEKVTVSTAHKECTNIGGGFIEISFPFHSLSPRALYHVITTSRVTTCTLLTVSVGMSVRGDCAP